MKIEATSPENHIEQLPEDRQAPMQHLRQVILDHLSHWLSGNDELQHDRVRRSAQYLSSGLSLRPPVAPTLSEHRFAKEFYCPLPHGAICQSATPGMVCSRIPQAFRT